MPAEPHVPLTDAPAAVASSRRRGVRWLVARAKAAAAWWSRTRPGRANARFSRAGGGVLTGGIAYAALFSVAAGLTLGLSVVMAVLGSNHRLRDTVVAAVAQALPGLVDSGDGQGGVPATSLHLSVGLSVTGVVALVTLVLSALSAMGALQTGLTAMLDLRSKRSAVGGRVRQLVGFAGLALAVVVAAVLGLALTSAAGWALGALGWSGGAGSLLRPVGVLVAFVVDGAVFVLLVRVLAHARPPRRDLLQGAAIAATGLGVVRLLGASVVVGSITANPILAPFAAVVVLLAWVNLVARIVLLTAAWTADPPAPDPTGVGSS